MLLSIVVPTYNRCSFLTTQLKKLVNEFVALTDEEKKLVEIWTFNNCSTDATPEVISYFNSNYSFLKTYSQDLNVGLAGNLTTAISVVNGKYIWFLSDDDYFVTGTVSTVLKGLCSNSKISYLFINYKYANQLATSLHDGFYNDAKSIALSLFEKSYGSLVFISSSIYKRDILIANLSNKFSHRISSPMFFSFLCASFGGIFVINEPLITFNNLNPPSYNGLKNILRIKFFEYYEILKNLGNIGYSKTDILVLINNLLKQNSHSFLLLPLFFPLKALEIIRFEGITFLSSLPVNLYHFFQRRSTA